MNINAYKYLAQSNVPHREKLAAILQEFDFVPLSTKTLEWPMGCSHKDSDGVLRGMKTELAWQKRYLPGNRARMYASVTECKPECTLFCRRTGSNPSNGEFFLSLPEENLEHSLASVLSSYTGFRKVGSSAGGSHVTILEPVGLVEKLNKPKTGQNIKQIREYVAAADRMMMEYVRLLYELNNSIKTINWQSVNPKVRKEGPWKVLKEICKK